MPKVPNLLTVSQFAAKHSAFSEPSLRSIIFNASEEAVAPNGFAPAIRRIGRKILLDEEVFFDCIPKQTAREERSETGVTDEDEVTIGKAQKEI